MQESRSEETSRLDLAKLAASYLADIQALHDLANICHLGLAQTDEESWKRRLRERPVMPSLENRLSHGDAVGHYRRWVLKNSLAEGLGLIALFLEDIRTIGRLLDGGLEKIQEDDIQTILVEERGEFLRESLETKLSIVESQLDWSSPYAGGLRHLQRVLSLLDQPDGRAASSGASGGEGVELVLWLFDGPDWPDQGLDPPGGGREVRKILGPGERVDLSEEEHLSALVLLALFVVTTVQRLTGRAPELGAVS
jgi:hypothetical protein